MKSILFTSLSSIVICYLLYNYFFPENVICQVTNDYIVIDDNGSKIPCLCFINNRHELEDSLSSDLIVLFTELKNQPRIHINFNYKLIGLPEYGNRNYRYDKDKLFLYKKNLFYENGFDYHPLYKNVDIQYEFDKDSLRFETTNDLKKYGNHIIIKQI